MYTRHARKKEHDPNGAVGTAARLSPEARGRFRRAVHNHMQPSMRSPLQLRLNTPGPHKQGLHKIDCTPESIYTLCRARRDAIIERFG